MFFNALLDLLHFIASFLNHRSVRTNADHPNVVVIIPLVIFDKVLMIRNSQYCLAVISDLKVFRMSSIMLNGLVNEMSEEIISNFLSILAV